MGASTFPSGGVSRSGATVDGHVAVWNGTSTDSIKDGGAPGSGSVTSVSVVTANGQSGSVATATTTPAITLNAPALVLTNKSADYTFVLGDANTGFNHALADNNARTFTIPANGSVAYPIGTFIQFVNQINALSIAITADTLVWANDGTTGTRTLTGYGMATALKLSATLWIISGTTTLT